MGVSTAGVSIKTNSKNYSLEYIVKSIFGNDFERTNAQGDIREDNWIVISKTHSFIHIRSAFYADFFFNDSFDANLKVLNHFFDNPELIIAFEQFSSGGTYSYAIIKDGKMQRQFRSLSYETTINFGELEPIEVDWKNGKITEHLLGDGEKETVITNSRTGRSCDEDRLPEEILNYLLFHELKIEDAEYPIEEFSFFKKVNIRKDENSDASNIKPKWWKFW